jgi:carboxymethylenebutenolidase
VTDVGIPTAGGTMPAYLARPASGQRAPGVLVIHEVFGLTPEMKAHAERLAGAGYLAVAPDLYFWGTKVRCLMATLLASSRGSGRAIDDIEQARRWLAGHEGCTGTVGIVGFCMGGGLALVCAPKGGYAAAAPNYGEVPTDAHEALKGICPVVASYASRDRFLRGRADRLADALEALGVPHDVKVYEGSTHGFMNPHPGLLATVTAKLMPLEYDPAAADDAWARIIAFFHTHLGAPG